MAEVKMDPLPGSNSHSNRNTPKPEPIEEKSETKVVAKATFKKKSFGEKMKEVFIGEDIQNVGDYILKEVVVPTIKNTIVDIIQNGISLLIFGESGINNKNKRRNGPYVSYGSYSSNSSRDRRRDDRRDIYSDKGYIVFYDRYSANEVLQHLVDIVDTYHNVTVANYYEKVNQVIDDINIPISYQDHKWGWTDLRYVDIKMERGGGWYIDLPRAEYID